LRRLGRSVLLLERSRHPRFALGESSTPLANLALERLARRFGLDDLWDLSNHGRWLDRFPQLIRGRKRGFTFYAHRPSREFENGAHNENRLLVAASPNDETSDTQWLRSAFDAHQVATAVAEGVPYSDATLIVRIERSGRGFHLTLQREGRTFDLAASFLVDAAGASSSLVEHLPESRGSRPLPLKTRLVYGHFRNVMPFAEAARALGSCLPGGPYADEWAAVHHLLAEGWMYELRFDDGLVSAGILFEALEAGSASERLDAPGLFRSLLDRYPTLALAWQNAEAEREIVATGPLPRCYARSVGRGWARLPSAYAFLDPLFSTGIAWSLLGVERVADLLAAGAPDERALAEYDALLAVEIEHQLRLIHGAYLLMPDFDCFCAWTFLYFVAASFQETQQRLLFRSDDGAHGGWAWDGFLGATDPLFADTTRRGFEKARRLAARGVSAVSSAARRAFCGWLERELSPRNLAGLFRPECMNLYPADPAILLSHARLLGMSRGEMEAALPRLLQ
jgi:FADH2 O2-dependent halogenase